MQNMKTLSYRIKKIKANVKVFQKEAQGHMFKIQGLGGKVLS